MNAWCFRIQLSCLLAKQTYDIYEGAQSGVETRQWNFTPPLTTEGVFFTLSFFNLREGKDVLGMRIIK